eukprot:1156471-Pelagomonas_calceolata.AAC.2
MSWLNHYPGLVQVLAKFPTGNIQFQTPKHSHCRLELTCQRGTRNARKNWLQHLKRDIPEAHWLPLQPPDFAIQTYTHQCLASNNRRKKFQSLLHDTHTCSHRCPQVRAAFHPAIYNKTLTSKIKSWRKIAYTDGSVIQQEDGSPPLVGSGVCKPSRDANQSSQQLQVHMKPRGHGLTNIINRAELTGILVALQQGHTGIASDSASCLSQISKQTFNPMCMKTHFHGELIRAISNVLEHSLHPVHFYKIQAHSGIMDNEGADACPRTAALTGTMDVALPDARNPFHNFYRLSLKSSYGRNGEPHHSRTAPIHHLTNLRDKLKSHMH